MGVQPHALLKPRHSMEVSWQVYAPVALHPVPIGQEDGPQS